MADTMPTPERLARAMEAALCPPQMIASARAGLYDDCQTTIAFPQIQLVADLRAIGQHALAQRVIEGEFDATADEWAAWSRSPEGRAAAQEILRAPPTSRHPPGKEV